MEVAVSYLKTSISKEETIKKIEATSAEYIHVDLADGLFVPNKNFHWNDIHALLQNCQKKLDIHLMTLDLERHINESLKLNPEKIAFHIEATKEIDSLIQKIKKENVKVGLAINNQTNIEALLPYLNKIDYVLVMSIISGYGGQKFIMSTIEKLKQLKKIQKNFSFQIEIDGGINSETIKYVKDNVDVVVSGSFICLSEDYEKQIQILKEKSK